MAEGIVRAAVDELAKVAPPPRRLVAVTVVIGALRQVVPETLCLAFEVLGRGTPVEGTALRITAVPLRCRCRRCSWEGQLEEMVFLCPACGAGDLDTIGGMELHLSSLEVEANEADDH